MSHDPLSKQRLALPALGEFARLTGDELKILAVWDLASIFGRTGQVAGVNLGTGKFEISALDDQAKIQGRVTSALPASPAEWAVLEFNDVDLRVVLTAGYRAAGLPIVRSMRSLALAAKYLSRHGDSLAITPSPIAEARLTDWSNDSGLDVNDLLAHSSWMAIDAHLD